MLLTFPDRLGQHTESIRMPWQVRDNIACVSRRETVFSICQPPPKVLHRSTRRMELAIAVGELGELVQEVQEMVEEIHLVEVVEEDVQR